MNKFEQTHEFRKWLASVQPEVVPLFSVNEHLEVATWVRSGTSPKRMLRRSQLMEETVVNIVEKGLRQDDWHGLLYIMGWGDLPGFRPLYVGKAGKRGVKNPISENLKNLAVNKTKFARWGDGLAYHIGDLSQVLFRWQAYRPPQQKYEKWADMLFVERDLPRLREKVSLALIPWYSSSVSPTGNNVSLEEAENELISLASQEFSDILLNVQGEKWCRPASADTARAPQTIGKKPLHIISDGKALEVLVGELEKCELVGLDVETCMRTQRLCLIQIATEQFIAIIDALAICDLSPLARIFGSEKILKIIHNATFERGVLRSVGLELAAVFDTLTASRRIRGKQPDGHSLAIVARRELNCDMDKTLQTSDWTRRPLTRSQIGYASLDADVLIDLYKVFNSFSTGRLL